MNNRPQKEHYSSPWCELPSGGCLCCQEPDLALASPAGLAVPSAEDPGSKELQQKTQCLCCSPSSSSDSLCQGYSCLAPNTGEKGVGNSEICLFSYVLW